MAVSIRPQSTTDELLRELLDVNRQILATLQQANTTHGSHSPLTRADRAVLAKILPAVSGAYGPETFTARDLVEDDRPAVRLVVGGRSVKQLGKLLARADGMAIDGLMLERQGLEFQVTMWRIVAV
jgi:hypothetical protein